MKVMDLLRTTFVIAVLSCISLAGGALLSSVENLTEAQVASLLDSNVQPPPRTTGFEELVPEQSIRINCYRPGGQFFQQVFLTDSCANIGEKIDLTRPIAIITHGWTENSNLTQYQQMAARFQRFVPDTNVCLLDWQPYATLTYQVAARQAVPLVAEQQSKFLLLLSRLQYPLEKVSLVGFSMGGQIAGLTGKSFGSQIGAIFALDPAGPLFTQPFDVGPTRRLTRADARYVQVIATCRYELGVGPLIGTQNFLPNGGFHPQPSCIDITQGVIDGIKCSHRYAVQLFTATLDPANVILGQKCLDVCPNLLFLQAGFCSDRVGFYARRIPGNFCL